MEPSPTLLLFPCHAVVSQMGHRSIAGYASVTTELGTPMVLVVAPAVPGDDTHEPLAEDVELIAPNSLYGVKRCTAEQVLLVRASERSRIYTPRARQIEMAEDAVEVAAAPDKAAHPVGCDCDDCIPY